MIDSWVGALQQRDGSILGLPTARGLSEVNPASVRNKFTFQVHLC
jgi:hypothetical protein